MVGDIFRSALLVLAFWGLLSGLWPAIGGITGQYAGAAETTTVHKQRGVITAPWDTEIAPSQSWIKVHVTADLKVTVLIVALNTRTIIVANNSGFAAADDFLGITGGQGNGTDVTLFGSHGGPVRYRISVHVHDDVRIADPSKTDADVDYTLKWEIQKMDPMVILGGLLLFNMFFVTEYILHMRRDIRALAKKVERASAEGVRAPSAALGIPIAAAPLGSSLGEAAPAPSRARGGFLGLGARESEPRAEAASIPEAAPLYTPPPPRYAAAAPPESYGPPAYASAYEPPPEPEPPAPVYEPPPPPPAARVAGRPPPAPPPPMAAPSPAATQEPVSKVRCPQCKHIVPVYTAERPTPIKCPNCGKRGMLTK